MYIQNAVSDWQSACHSLCLQCRSLCPFAPLCSMRLLRLPMLQLAMPQLLWQHRHRAVQRPVPQLPTVMAVVMVQCTVIPIEAAVPIIMEAAHLEATDYIALGHTQWVAAPVGLCSG